MLGGLWGGCFGSSVPSLSCFAEYELLGEAQLKGSGREGHMMHLCQNKKKASFARVPNGIFQNWRGTLLFLLTVSDKVKNSFCLVETGSCYIALASLELIV